MADIELVVKIPEELYKATQIIEVKYEDTIQIPLEVIANGIPLPKGHGRIVDIGLYEGKVIASRTYCGVNKLIEVAELGTLIEADKENE